MTHTIRHRVTNAVLWEGEADTVKDALDAAIAADANLGGANLRDANLGGANLGGANLGGANLTMFRDDVWAVLSSAPAEVPGLLAALKAGKVDGSTYQGECACLVGTIANVRGCDYDAIPGLTPNASRLAEVWFTRITAGDTPETSESAKIAAEWIEDWLTRMRGAFGSSDALAALGSR